MKGSFAIEGGFVKVEEGAWLVSRGQPASFRGSAVRRRRPGWIVADRAQLELFDTSGDMECACQSRPFLTHIPCAAPIFAVSSKVLVAPAVSRAGSFNVKVVPFSIRSAFCATEFGSEWVVMATRGRTARVQVADGDTLSARPDAVVAWTGAKPTGFCPKIGVWDVFLPRGPKDMYLNFHGPAVVWLEGVAEPARLAVGRRAC